VDRDTRTTDWDYGEPIIEVIGHLRRDSMSDESFELTVEMAWGKQIFTGRGRAPH
jgi:hypothetical protein